MAHDDTDRTDRRTFLQAGALADGFGPEFSAGQRMRKTWSQKTQSSRSASWARPASRSRSSSRGRSGSNERMLRTAYANGIRVFDTAKVYGTEPSFKKWFEQRPEGSQADLPRHQGHAEDARARC